MRMRRRHARRFRVELTKRVSRLMDTSAPNCVPHRPAGVASPGWRWCAGCETWMLVCPRCGNNACNGLRGTAPDGSPCTLCPQVYEEQDRAWASKEPVEEGSLPPVLRPQ